MSLLIGLSHLNNGGELKEILDSIWSASPLGLIAWILAIAFVGFCAYCLFWAVIATVAGRIRK